MCQESHFIVVRCLAAGISDFAAPARDTDTELWYRGGVNRGVGLTGRFYQTVFLDKLRDVLSNSGAESRYVH